MATLNQKDFLEIERKAVDLISKCRIKGPLVDVENVIAKHLGLTVFDYELGEVSGALIIQNNHAYIGCNPKQIAPRRRFTIAHEIGHYYLHCQPNDPLMSKDQLFVDKDFIVKYRNSNNYTFAELKQEQQANAFAAALLMPMIFIKAELDKEELKEIDENDLIVKLAEKFGVSVIAMTYRLENISPFFYDETSKEKN